MHPTKTCLTNPLAFGLIALVRDALSVFDSVSLDKIWSQSVFFLSWVLTIPAHAGGDAFLEAAVLTPVPVHPLDRTLLVLRAWSILDLLLD